MKRFLLSVFLMLNFIPCVQSQAATEDISSEPKQAHVALIKMRMMILPGTASFLSSTIEAAHAAGAKLLIVELDTPGGILDTSQQMIQTLFKSALPVVVYVAPQGATATSAGVFITMAGHIAAMSPGTSIGAAHPVQGDGKDIEGDMRKKAENMTIAMVKSVAEQRGRNVDWAEKSVKDSISVTEQEALKENVIDVVAKDYSDLLKQIAGKKVKLDSAELSLEDYSNLPITTYEMSYQDKFMNVLANPNVAALLWLAATTGLSIELYNPGLIFPGVVGVICLILALIVSQIIPLSQGAIALMVVGALLIGLELVTGSLVLGIGGLVALVLGALYIVDTSKAPELAVSAAFIGPIALVLGSFMLYITKSAYDVLRGNKSKGGSETGTEGMLGKAGLVVDLVSADSGRVLLDSEYWNAVSKGENIEVGAKIEVVSRRDGLLLEVKKIG
jgi:membrane-bound serine protease (ClpP class)